MVSIARTRAFGLLYALVAVPALAALFSWVGARAFGSRPYTGYSVGLAACAALYLPLSTSRRMQRGLAPGHAVLRSLAETMLLVGVVVAFDWLIRM
jgi:hypothetical protein